MFHSDCGRRSVSEPRELPHTSRLIAELFYRAWAETSRPSEKCRIKGENAMPAANKFVLKGPGVEVDYTIGASSAIPALVFTAGAFQKKFKPNDVLSEDTGLGRLVSVALLLTIDTGGERFGFFLPFIDVARDHTAHF